MRTLLMIFHHDDISTQTKSISLELLSPKSRVNIYASLQLIFELDAELSFGVNN